MVTETKLLVDELVERLNEINNGALCVENFKIDGVLFALDDKVSLLAEETLLFPSGKQNWGNITHLMTKGFEVLEGKKFGKTWTIGLILTNKGIIMYG